MRFVSVCVQRGVRVCSRYSCARGENIFGKIVYFSLLILASGKIDKLGTNKMFFECHNLALCRTLDTPRLEEGQKVTMRIMIWHTTLVVRFPLLGSVPKRINKVECSETKYIILDQRMCTCNFEYQVEKYNKDGEQQKDIVHKLEGSNKDFPSLTMDLSTHKSLCRRVLSNS